MPLVEIATPEIVQSISRPIIRQIISQVQTSLKLNSKSRILFNGDLDTAAQPGSTLDDNTNKSAAIDGGLRVEVQVNEDYDNQYLSNNNIVYQNNLPFFIDSELSVELCPVRMMQAVEINFKVQSPSKTELTRIRDTIHGYYVKGSIANIHTVTYHYPIPVQYIDLLKEIYINKQRLVDTGSFEDYIKKNIISTGRFASNLIGSNDQLVIGETLTRIQGIYGFEGQPDKIQINDNNQASTFEFTYRFGYEVPKLITAKYPLAVYNTFLPEQYLQTEVPYTLDTVNKKFDRSVGCLNYFDTAAINERNLPELQDIKLPSYDDFDIDITLPGMSPLFTALVSIDESNLKDILNFNDIGDYCIDSDILEFMLVSEAPYITSMYKSIFYTILYKKDKFYNDRTLLCLADGSLSSKTELDIKLLHRFRLGIVTDLSLIDADFFRRLTQWPKAKFKLAKALGIDESLFNNQNQFNMKTVMITWIMGMSDGKV